MNISEVVQHDVEKTTVKKQQQKVKSDVSPQKNINKKDSIAGDVESLDSVDGVQGSKKKKKSIKALKSEVTDEISSEDTTKKAKSKKKVNPDQPSASKVMEKKGAEQLSSPTKDEVNQITSVKKKAIKVNKTIKLIEEKEDESEEDISDESPKKNKSGPSLSVKRLGKVKIFSARRKRDCRTEGSDPLRKVMKKKIVKPKSANIQVDKVELLKTLEQKDDASVPENSKDTIDLNVESDAKVVNKKTGYCYCKENRCTFTK